MMTDQVPTLMKMTDEAVVCDEMMIVCDDGSSLMMMIDY